MSVYTNIVSQEITLVFTMAVAISLLFFKGKPICGATSIKTWILAIAVIALMAAIFLATQRNTYLPFLGDTAFPTGVLMIDQLENEENLKDRPMRITVPMSDVPDQTLVVYWAAKVSSDSKVITSPQEAYAGSMNGGVARVKDGKAVFAIGCPAEYIVRGSAMKRHVHYRVQLEKGGMFGPVRTINVNC